MTTEHVVFVTPNTAWFGKRYWHNFPYTIGLLGAILRQRGYRVSVLDANIDNLDEGEVGRALAGLRPDVVAVSAMTVEYRRCVHRAFEIAKTVCPAAVTVMGGIYPTLSPEIATRDANVDYFVIGEGEKRLVKLLKALEAGGGFEAIDGLAYRRSGELVSQPPTTRVEDLDGVPYPDYSLFDLPKYTTYGQTYTQNFQFRSFPWAQTITSRGCPYSCTFCASNKVYGRPIRYRTAENVLREVDMLVSQHGIREIIFVDDAFLQSKKRAIEIFQGLIDRKYDLLWKSNNLSIFLMDDEILDAMKKSGCYQVSVSIESGHPNTLKRIRKPLKLEQIRHAIDKIKALDIELISNFVIGFPGETWEEILETFRYAESIDIDYVLFSIATPLPATELYEQCVREKLLPADFSFENFDYYGFGRGVITTDEFTPFELQVVRAFEWDRINFKTPGKKAKIASMLGITVQELDQWRRETRRKLGVQVQVADQVLGPAK